MRHSLVTHKAQFIALTPAPDVPLSCISICCICSNLDALPLRFFEKFKESQGSLIISLRTKTSSFGVGNGVLIRLKIVVCVKRIKACVFMLRPCSLHLDGDET